jgi:hypothetical protein
MLHLSTIVGVRSRIGTTGIPIRVTIVCQPGSVRKRKPARRVQVFEAVWRPADLPETSWPTAPGTGRG